MTTVTPNIHKGRMYSRGVIHESRNLRQARPEKGHYVDLLRRIGACYSLINLFYRIIIIQKKKNVNTFAGKS